MSHLTLPNKGVMEPVVVRLANGKLHDTWRSIPESDMTEEQFEQDIRHFNFCHKNRYTIKTVNVWEAIHIFREDLPSICNDHIRAGENVEYWKELLGKLRNRGRLKFRDQLERAKEVPIMSLVNSEVRMNKINCIVHDDSSASLHIYSDTNRWWCFGCQSGGSTIDFIMMSNGCTLSQAIDYLT